MQAHLMAFSKPQKKPGQQDTSFPCSSTSDLQEEEEGQQLARSNNSSRQLSSGASSTQGGHYSRESEQQLVHTQCWGKDLAGLLLPC